VPENAIATKMLLPKVTDCHWFPSLPAVRAVQVIPSDVYVAK
jgi:hypothetical protein